MRSGPAVDGTVSAAHTRGSDQSRPADFSVMRPGVRFADVLDDALTATGWEAAGRDEPVCRSAHPRAISYTPLYNLHTPTHGASFAVQGSTVGRVVTTAYAEVVVSSAFVSAGRGLETEPSARIWSHPRRSESGHSSRTGIVPEVHAAGSNASRPEPQSVRTPVPATAPPRRTRRLTTAQSRSLATFNQLGADVRADFSAGELRSAFRMLARTYHPDRHPRASVSDRQRLAQQFTTIRASYETLLTALDAPDA